MKYTFLFACIVFAMTQSVFGQGVKKAERFYNDFGYKSTVSIYEKELQRKNTDLTQENKRQIANSYRLFHDTQNAEKWYAQYIESTSNPVDYLHYAQVLQSNGNAELAKKYFLLYDDQFGTEDARGKVLAEAIDRIEDFKREGVEVKNERVINSRKIEFSPSFYGGGLVFVTTNSPKVKSKKDIWLDDNYMSLYESTKNSDGSLTKPKLFSADLNTKFHEGPVSFSKQGDQIFYTKSNYNRGKKYLSEDGVLKLQIFSAQEKNEKWTRADALPFNDKESDDAHPSLSADGQHLYFASDRDGGIGGMDIYVSKFKNNQWSEPENLGATINTPGNELFPFIHDDGTLYFSSEGHAGLGGLDIYSSVYFEGAWAEPVNMGAPINSPMDDLGFIINILNSEGYFASDRSEGMGKDDIYSFKVIPDELKKPTISRLNATICTQETGTTTKVPNVTIRVSENITWGDDDDKVYTTDTNGDLNIKLDPEIAYAFKAEKNGYRISEKVFSTEGVSDKENIAFCLGMTPVRDNCINILGVVTNAKDGSRIPNASIALTDECTGRMTTLTSNLLGEFESACLSCECAYNIKGLKDGYLMVDQQLDMGQLNCDENANLYYNIQLFSIHDDPRLTNNSSISRSTDPFNVTVGTNIILEDIYYDFDKHNIRNDAARTLDRLAGLLRAYPMMEIQLSAHTDSRGTTAYNQSLSQKRAESARSYLLANGIAGHRIGAIGFGEGILRNHCADGIACSEEQHQYNRRTEVKVTSMGGADIPVSYLNNSPTEIDRSAPVGRSSSYVLPPVQSVSPTYAEASLLSVQPQVIQASQSLSQQEYKIQIFSSSSPDRNFDNLSDLGNIELEHVPNKRLTRYLISKNLTYASAQNVLADLRSRGYGKSFIVSYVNGERME